MTHSKYQKIITKKLAKWQKRKSRPLHKDWEEAALLLYRLDLDSVSEELKTLYAPLPRGKKPFNPTSMLRAMLLMCILGLSRVDKFAEQLRSNSRLAIIAGFKPHKTPSVGTFYNFIDRLEDGPYEKPRADRVKLSKIRKGKHLRNLKKEKEEREKIREKILSECDSITQNLKAELLKSAHQPRPEGFLKRLEDLLMKTVVVPSAQRGLLGDLNKIILSGDGSALETGANSLGRPTCSCWSEGIYDCDHDRFYGDRTANWGYDSYREQFFFGHSFYHHTISVSGHDLPVHILIGQASESDFTKSLKSLDRLIKSFAENKLDVSIYAASYDKGHDAVGIYQYLNAKKIHPVIPLNARTGQYPKPTGNAEVVNSQGIPLCPAGIEMRKHSKGPNGRIYFNCPVKRPTHQDGKYVMMTHEEECPLKVLCQPDTKMGPVVYVSSCEDPRLYPAIARDSKEYKEIYNLRGGCERSNSVKKIAQGLAHRPCRSDTHYLFRLYLISILEHVKAWLAEDRKKLGTDWKVLIDPNKIHIRVPAA